MVLVREAVGQTLRAARTSQGRTLRDVARDARVSLGYLSEVERGQRRGFLRTSQRDLHSVRSFTLRCFCAGCIRAQAAVRVLTLTVVDAA